MEKNKNLVKNTVLLAIANIMTKGLIFIMIPFFSAWLSTEDFGTFDLVCTYVLLLIPLVSIASANSIFRFSIDEQDEEKKKYITNGFLIYY